MESTVGIALLGCGTVGGGVAELLATRRAQIKERSGASYALVGIANRRRDPIELIEHPNVDLVVECIGGTTRALDCIERALELHKHVVTANKDVIATQGPRLRALAAAKGVTLRYEAAVASAVPIVATLDGPLASDEIFEVCGILNGTCNFILGEMRAGVSFAAALAQAQTLGYAEADPRGDVEGTDSAHKLAILIQHAFGIPVVTGRIAHRGIDGLTSATVRRARQHGYEIKLLAYAQRSGTGCLAEVGPILVPFTHPFAYVSGVENIIRLQAVSSGVLHFRGAGAGRDPSAAAVTGDVVAALRSIAQRLPVTRPAPQPLSPPAVAGAFERFPAFAGYPVLTQHAPASHLRADSLPGTGARHVSHLGTKLTAV